jgi:PEGA domain
VLHLIFRRGAMKKLMIIGITAVLMMAPLAASAHVGVLVGPRFAWGWYSPYWGPYPYGYAYNYAPRTGAVKFDTHVKDAEVYINGAYAGTVGKLKTINLRPGSYDIEVRAVGRPQFDEKVYVAAGKTLHLNPDLRVPAQTQAQP